MSSLYADCSAFPTALPVPGTRFTTAFEYGKSLWGRTCKLECELPTGESINYFLKVSDALVSTLIIVATNMSVACAFGRYR